ncbi:MAG: choice-of-anchor Q domain-containing protein [Candidatus Promineifilaceae bacterium]
MKKRPWILILILLSTVLIIFLALPRFASAVSIMEQQNGPAFTVNTIDDHDDGQCTAGDCTLREAINAANAMTDTNTITFSLSGTIALTATLPGITTEVDIDGAGQQITVSGSNAYRVMVISNTATVNLVNLTIADGFINDAGQNGAGLLSYGTLTVTNSTFTGNSAPFSAGGAINIRGGSAAFVNSTFSGNNAQNGGAIYIYGGLITIIHSTISSNNGGGFSYLYGITTFYNSIIANNPGDDDCHYFGTGGLLYVDNYNLDSDGTCDDATTQTAEQLNLGPLADNGGDTQTMALLAGSTAVDAADLSYCPPTDQRGAVRPFGSGCDVGAFERVNTAPLGAADAYDTDKNSPLIVSAPGVLDNDIDGENDPLTAVLVSDVSSGTLNLELDGSFTYTPNLDFVGEDIFTYKANDGSLNSNTAAVTITVNYVCPTFPIAVGNESELNEAVNCYNALSTPGSYDINITADITLTAPVTSVGNPNNASLQINGGGHTIDGAGAYRQFTIADGDVTIDNVTLQDGLATNTCTVTAPSPRCGGAVHISSSAVLTLSNSTIMNSTASLGGGLFNQGGIVTISSSAILSNSTNYRGGGIGNRDGQMTIVDSTIAGNGSAYGGGISNESTGVITITGSTLSGNYGSLSTGAMYSEGDAMTLSNSTISGNFSSSGDISGILNNSDTALVVNTTIANNTADTGPGFSQGSGSLTLRNSIIAGNGGSGDCSGVTGAYADDTNLDSDGSCGDAVQSANINLGPLQDNGGPTFTHALLFGSDALDAGDSVICAAAPVNGLDQRGMVRPQGAGCDIGAYEAAPFEIRTLSVILSGTGQGTVSSTPAGIDCMPDCSEDYEVGTVVTLTAAAQSGSIFFGWQGPCSGTGDCVVTMDQAMTVTAVFTLEITTYQTYLPFVSKP